MSCWACCGLRNVVGKARFGNGERDGKITTSIAHDEAEKLTLQPEEQCNWFFQEAQVKEEKDDSKHEPLIVRAISGAEIVALSPRVSENALDLKGRIQKKEGTAAFMQKLVQGSKVLDDKDIVKNEPLVLVRVPRRRMLITSLHADLRSYDMETGGAMRTVPSQFLQLSCMIVDWESARCFTGSHDGSVRVWDVYSNECLGTLNGPRAKVCALSFDKRDRLVVAAETGHMRSWKLNMSGFDDVRVRRSKEWQVGLSGALLMCIDWTSSLAVISGKDDATSKHMVAAYSLQSFSRVWSWTLKGFTSTLSVDWDQEQCMTAPYGDFLELRGFGASALDSPRQFAHHRLHRKGLVRVDWTGARVIFISEPFGVELWSLITCEMMYSVRDTSGDGTHVISLDVDWHQLAPQAITCRTYMDWEAVAGEVSIQHWDLQEDGDIKCVAVEHPMIGGFDITAAVAQISI